MAKHYSQQQPRFVVVHEQDTNVVAVRGFGLLSADMLRAVIAQWNENHAGRGEHVLVDLRDISGYGPGCARVAREWVAHAHEQGVRRVALLASSSVVRTALRVIASGVEVKLRSFDAENDAYDWLNGKRKRRGPGATTSPSPVG